MLPDRISNPGPLTYESGALPIALRGPMSENEGTDTAEKKAFCNSVNQGSLRDSNDK